MSDYYFTDDELKSLFRERAEWLADRAGLHIHYAAPAREQWIMACIEIFWKCRTEGVDWGAEITLESVAEVEER